MTVNKTPLAKPKPTTLRPIGKLRPWRRSRVQSPRLVFDARAWLKLQYLCHLGDTEVGAFAISDPDHPLRIVDLVLIQQTCSSVSVEFEDESVADFFENQVEAGRTPDSFARIWVHTHPGDSPDPSGLDEETFSRVFGPCSWAVMFILARGGATYCRLRVSAPGRSSVALSASLPVEVDYSTFAKVELDDAILAWHSEYATNVTAEPEWSLSPVRSGGLIGLDEDELDALFERGIENGELDELNDLDRDEPMDEVLEELLEAEGGFDEE